MKRVTLRQYDIFWDNGKYVAVREIEGDCRRNIAPENCRTKRQALEAARADRDMLNDFDSDDTDIIRDSRDIRTAQKLANSF